MTWPGRPENPLKTDSGAIADFAGELRRMRKRAKLTYRELSAKTGRSPSTLTAAADGKQLPSWQVTLAWIQECGGDRDTVLRLYERACAETGRPAPGPDLSGEEPPDPATASTAEEFLGRMIRLRVWAGDPSLRTMNQRSSGRLPPSTISEALRRDSLPRRDLVLDYVRACYVVRVGYAPDRAVRDWERAWNIIKSREKRPTPADPEAGVLARQATRVLGATLILALIGLVLYVAIALTAGDVMQRPAAGTGYGPPLPSMPQICTRNGPVVFVVSGRQNSPAPVLTGSMQSAASTAVREGSAIGLVDLDGRPHMTLAGAFSDSGANPTAYQVGLRQREYLSSLASAVRDIRAKFPGADVLDALHIAGKTIRAACSYGGTVYLEDSGLQEVGPVNFSQPGMLGASPADVASFLATAGELPQLKGLTVVLAGLGDTAPPQRPLSISQEANVIAIWTAIVKAGGATSVGVDPTPLSGPAPTHVPAVLPVPVSAVQAWTPSDPSYVFLDSGPVGFEPDTAVFRDPAAAGAALRQLAQYLVANPSAKMELTGTTARSGTLAQDLTLSGQRAATVKVALVHMGASPGQIVTQGLGWQFPGYINDRGPGGNLLASPAEHNRSVIVTKI